MSYCKICISTHTGNKNKNTFLYVILKILYLYLPSEFKIYNQTYLEQAIFNICVKDNGIACIIVEYFF